LLNATYPSWPIPQWTEPRLEQLRAEASASARDPFVAMLAKVKLRVAAGRISDAREALRQAEPLIRVASMDPGMFRNFLSAAIVAHGADLAGAWLSERFKTAYALDIDVAPLTVPYEVVHLTIRGNTARFVFCASMFESAAFEALLNRWVDIFPIFDAFMNSPHRVDGDVDINLGDGCLRPGIAFCANKPGYFLIPDAIYMDSGRYRAYRDAMRRGNPPWADRQPMAVWRGATTGSPADPAIGWPSLPRVTLCQIGQTHPDLIDAGITSVGQIDDPKAREWLEARNLLRDYMPAERFQYYRYQIDIDGNSNSWPGLIAKLLSGSPVLKVASPRGFRQWYYDRLKPWINYVPVDETMRDLVDKIIWLRAHDEVARKIGDHGRDLAEALTDEQEIARAAPVFAAAIRTAGGLPSADHRFSAGATGNHVLRTGWLEPETDGVNASGFEARLELQKPYGLGDFVLIVELSPVFPPPRRVTIVANGEVILQRTLSDRATLYCPLVPRVLSASETLKVSICLPDSKLNASRTNPLDTRMLSVKLHRIALKAAGCYTGDELRDIDQGLMSLVSASAESKAHDLWDSAQASPEARPITIHTAHGTILYADLLSGRVRHGPVPEAPRNLFLIAAGSKANMIRTGADGARFGVRLRPEGSLAPRTDRAPSNAEGFVPVFDMVATGDPGAGHFALRGSGLYVCADPTGEVSLSRPDPGPWEQFSVWTGSA
jgi:hypothetical protein